MAERIVLDPSQVADSRTALEISDWVAEAGADWGDAEIQTYVAEQDRGSTPVDFRVPNRVISVPLRLKDVGGTAFATARANIQQKAARLQQEGGWGMRVLNSGGTVYFDIVNASLRLGGSWMQANRSVDQDAVLTLEALPDFYGDEVTLADHVETSAAELIFTETGVKGDYPGRVRIVVDEDDADTQLGLIWGWRSRHYSSSDRAQSEYEAEELQALDTARKVALTGASGGTVVQHGTISTSWTPIVGTNLGGTGYLAHTGTNRVFARIYSTSGTAVQARFIYDVGDLVNPAENDAWRVPGPSNFYVADLGEVRLDKAPVGTHRWQGQIQAKGDTGSEDFKVDKVWIVNQDEGAGVLRAGGVLHADDSFVTFQARDEFNQSAGVLTAKTLPVGGTWSGEGDADDFSLNTTSKLVERTALSDPSFGRRMYASTPTLTTAYCRVDIRRGSTTSTSTVSSGLMLRRVDSSNYGLVQLEIGGSAGGRSVQAYIVKVIAGTPTTVALNTLALSGIPDDQWIRVSAVVWPSGVVEVFLGSPGGALDRVLVGQDSVFATGGTLASGKFGFFDGWGSATACTRSYDNFAVWTPEIDAVLFASQSAELRFDGHYRKDSGGTAYGPVSIVEGDLPRIPPAGFDGRTTELFLKASRGDVDQVPDSGIDDISARITYRPSYLTVAGTS